MPTMRENTRSLAKNIAGTLRDASLAIPTKGAGQSEAQP